MHSDTSETFALASRRVMRFGAAYAIAVVVVNALALAGLTAVSNGAVDPTAVGTQASVLIGGAVAGTVTLVCVICLLISTVVWLVSAHRLSAAGPGPIGYGALAAGVVLTVLAYVVPGRMPTVATTAAAEIALRVGGVAVLLAGVAAVRARLRRETGHELPAATPPLVTADDWDASKWDPEVLRDIERRRKAG
ncbi:hypothetical protein [Actinoplanes sp. URMC 104]|uniref:hypothetical protein n=1 Tax=Actinoplanes sp. URMC 104 TaxID=3423409 RepID=UPI003F1BB24B